MKLRFRSKGKYTILSVSGYVPDEMLAVLRVGITNWAHTGKHLIIIDINEVENPTDQMYREMSKLLIRLLKDGAVVVTVTKSGPEFTVNNLSTAVRLATQSGGHEKLLFAALSFCLRTADVEKEQVKKALEDEKVKYVGLEKLLIENKELRRLVYSLEKEVNGMAQVDIGFKPEKNRAEILKKVESTTTEILGSVDFRIRGIYG